VVPAFFDAAALAGMRLHSTDPRRCDRWCIRHTIAGAGASLVRLAAALTAALLLAAGQAAVAADWPVRGVRLVVGFTAGGGVDVSARSVAEALTRIWKQQVIVENRPGANGAIAAVLVAKAEPDGYTLFVGGASSIVGSHALKRDLPFNVFRDFQPISMVRKAPFALVVHPSVPAKTTTDLIALARRKPGNLTYASFGIGSSNHLVTEVFKARAAVDLLHVPYKGSSPALTDLMGGQVDLVMDTVESVLPHVRAGRMRAIGYAGPTRSPLLPDAPTVEESGLKGFEGATWDGLFAPAQTPAAVVERINRDLRTVVAEQAASLRSRGMEPAANTPQAFRTYIESQIAEWTDAARRAGIKPE